jgi:hypothetical protein
MKRGLAQLEKLRGKSLREIRVRGAQELAKLSERMFGAAELSDAELFRQIVPRSRNGNGEGSAMLILERIRSSTVGASSNELPFFPSLLCRDEVSSIIKHRFPEERRALLENAERAIKGRFDLLGFDDLSFGDPIDWHLEPTRKSIGGKRTPLVHWSKINYLDPQIAGDKKVTWELNRHAHFVTLGQAYWLTGDERFVAAFVSQASSWMNSNPPKLGINWASSLELAFRVIAWTWAIYLFADSDRLTPGFVTRFLKFIVVQGRHIESYLSHYFSPNTHLTGEALGLFYLGTALPELARATRWRDTGLNVLLEQLARHIRSDGTYFEQSSYYHRYTADFYTHLVVLARAGKVGLPPEVKERLSLALEHLMFITRPDGTSPLYGDDDGGRLLKLNAREANDFRDTLSTGAALFERGDWKHVADNPPIETLWLLGPEALAKYDQVESREPVETSRAFSEGGYCVMRDGWSAQSSYAIVDCGPHGSSSCAHAHADALAFEYAAEGRTWLVDPGTFTYTGDAKARDWFRASTAHNTVTVDGLSQSLPAGPFAWEHVAESHSKAFISDNTFDYFEGSHDGYERLDDPVTHTRSILFVKPDRERELTSFIVVRDRFDARAQHRYALRYHAAPGCMLTADDNTVTALDVAGHALSISAFGVSKTTTRVEEGWESRCYGQRESASVALFEAEGHGPQQFVSVITSRKSRRGGPPWPPQIEEMTGAFQQAGAATEDRPYMAFSMGTEQARDLLVISEGANEFKNELMHEQLTAKGSMAWARFIKGEFERGCLIRGTRLEIASRLTVNSPTTASCCAVQIYEDRVEITIHGVTRFDLSFDIPPSKFVVNKSSFDPLPGSRVFSLALEDSGWKITQED